MCVRAIHFLDYDSYISAGFGTKENKPEGIIMTYILQKPEGQFAS
jgi:hypothetical protein